MNTEFISVLAKELATRINKAVNIPLMREDDEQKFFEMVVMIILDIALAKLGKEMKTSSEGQK